jgi:hypothetical protein
MQTWPSLWPAMNEGGCAMEGHGRGDTTEVTDASARRHSGGHGRAGAAAQRRSRTRRRGGTAEVTDASVEGKDVAAWQHGGGHRRGGAA